MTFVEFDFIFAINERLDPDFQFQIQRLADEDGFFFAFDFHEQQIAGFAFRGHEAHRTRLFRLAIDFDFQSRNLELAFTSRRDRVLHRDAAAFTSAPVDDRDL